MTEFKVGDRVRAIGPDWVRQSGLEGTVRRVTRAGPVPVLVSFDNWTGGHDGDCHYDGRDKSHYWMSPQFLELASRQLEFAF